MGRKGQVTAGQEGVAGCWSETGEKLQTQQKKMYAHHICTKERTLIVNRKRERRIFYISYLLTFE